MTLPPTLNDPCVPDVEDARLLQQWRDAADRSALERLYARHAEALWRLAMGVCGHAADADDAVQQALLQAMRGAHQWRGGAVRSWLLSITANSCREQLRRARRRTRHERAAPAPLPLAPPDDDEAAGQLRQALAQLPAAYAQPLILAYLEGMTSDAIAAVLGLSAAAVRKRCERALDRLRADRRLALLDPAHGAVLVAALQALPRPLPGSPHAHTQALARGVARSIHPWASPWLWPGLAASLGAALLAVVVCCAWQGSSRPAPTATQPPVPAAAPGPAAVAVDPDRAILDQRITLSLRTATLSGALDAIIASLAGRPGFDYYPYFDLEPETVQTRDFHQATVREVLEAFTAPTWSWRLAHRHLCVYRQHGPVVERTFSGWEIPLDELHDRILAWCRGPLTDQAILDQLLDYNRQGYCDERAVPIPMLEGDQEVVQAVQQRLAAMSAHGVPWGSSAIITCGYLRLRTQLPALLAQLRSAAPGQRDWTRASLIQALGWMGDAQAVPLLSAIAGADGGWRVAQASWIYDEYDFVTPAPGAQPPGDCLFFNRERCAAVASLGRIADPSAIHALRAILADREPYAPRLAAARLLAKLGCQEAVPEIQAALRLTLQGPTLEHWGEGEDFDLIHLTWSLCHLDPQGGVAQTIALLHTAALRPDLLHGLVDVQDARLVPALLELLRSDGALAAQLAYHALLPTGTRQQSPPDRYLTYVLAAQANAPQLLIAALSEPGDAGSDWRNVATQTLGCTTDCAGERFLGLRVSDSSRSAEVRATAAFAIGCSAQVDAIQPLSAALTHDPSSAVRCAAVGALGRLGLVLRDRAPTLDGRIPAIEAMLLLAMRRDPDPAVRSATVRSYPTTPEWVEALTSDLMSESDPGVAATLVDGIGGIRSDGAVEIDTLHVHDRCMAALICAPPVAQPAAHAELDQWLTSPGDGQTPTQLLVRLKRALIQCQGSGAAAMEELTALLDATPPARAAVHASTQREF